MKFNKRFAFSIAIVGFWLFLTCIIVVNLRANHQEENAKSQKIKELLHELDAQIQRKQQQRHDIAASYRDYFNKFQLAPTEAGLSSTTVVESESENHVNTNIHIDFRGKYIDDDFNKPVIPIIVLACNRVSVDRSLKLLVKYRPSKEQFPIIVSQDCRHEPTYEVIKSFKDEVQLIQQPDLSEPDVPTKDMKFRGYYKISRHYNFALNTTFKYGYDFVVIVEDDLEIAPDFYEYFLGTFPLLRADKTIMCVSCWNDNGKKGLIDEFRPDLLYRSDFFPGLGWMMSRELWEEIGPKFPKAFWDDWIREKEQRLDRVCIRPELPRTRTFGKVGVSNGLFYEKHLKYIELTDQSYQFSTADLTYLLKENYDRDYMKDVYTMPVVTLDELRRDMVNVAGPVRIPYSNRNQYKSAAKALGIMDDFKSGVPRTAYKGIVSTFYKNRRVFLAPGLNWKGYDPSWS